MSGSRSPEGSRTGGVSSYGRSMSIYNTRSPRCPLLHDRRARPLGSGSGHVWVVRLTTLISGMVSGRAERARCDGLGLPRQP
eukprot:1980219-Prymnesium_polylepis.1